jgi:hypothetical protein
LRMMVARDAWAAIARAAADGFFPLDVLLVVVDDFFLMGIIDLDCVYVCMYVWMYGWMDGWNLISIFYIINK